LAAASTAKARKVELTTSGTTTLVLAEVEAVDGVEPSVV
jgi:hypothetical protein